MKKSVFDLPCTNVQVSVNNKRIEFIVNPSSYNKFWFDDKEYIPLGCYELMIDISSFKIGDIIQIQFKDGHFQNDSGGEKMLNIIGELGDFILGMGVPATDDYEDVLIHGEGGWPSDMNPTQ